MQRASFRRSVFIAFFAIIALQALVSMVLFAGFTVADGRQRLVDLRVAQVGGLTAALERSLNGNNYANIADAEAISSFEDVDGLLGFRVRGTSTAGNDYAIFYRRDLGFVVRGTYPDGYIEELEERRERVQAALQAQPENPKLQRIASDLALSYGEVERTRKHALPLDVAFADADTATVLDDGRLQVPVRLDSGTIHYVFENQSVTDAIGSGVLQIALASLGSLLLALPLAYLLSGRVVDPLRTLVAALKDGMLQSQTQLPGLEAPDEVGDVARRIDTLAAHNRELIEDMEERHHQLEAAHRARTVILENVAQALLLVDADGVLKPQWSATSEAFFPHLAVGQPIWEVLAPVDRTAARALRDAWGDLDQLPSRVTVGLKHFRVQFIPLDPNILVLITDVTEEDASRAKSLFLASMSHELRTPLNAVIGYADLVLEDLEDTQTAEASDVERIREAGNHLLGLVDQVLDLSRIEAGKRDYAFAPVSAQDVSHEVVAAFETRVEQATLTTQVLGQPDAIWVDPGAFRQILDNLVGNALKFADSVEIVVTQADAAVQVDVVDDGPGIPRDMLERIFLPFEQGASTNEGTGLGLSISRRLATDMHGQLVALPRDGGATFRLRFPSQETRAPQMAV